MGGNLLCLRVSTSRYPTAASSHRTLILRWTVKPPSTHTDGLKVLQRHLTMTLFFSRRTRWYLWTAVDSSSMTVSMQNVKLIFITCAPLWAETISLFFICFVIEVLDALHMDTMMSHIDSWRSNPESFLRERGLNPKPAADNDNEEVFVLIVEGFLIFNHR